ncbi:DUF3618 domain-containing protein [Anianabacter salinae]|uniref:DUF3618 domain-containing protein n=1 Tax=Anianabacter salinae TaxID=2851023 RepID=UPI00225DCF08|nr:DUF3618 domain-containing protein [Anianabacter salinae]MBV0913203.1 DUF3618 domain-containing protein [Anianabacter salinae]
MTSEHRTSDEIERDLELQRSDLSRAIDEIQSRFTPEAVLREVTRGLGTHGSDLGRSFGDAAKQNPVAISLTGVGLAWMIFGRSHDDRPARDGDDRHPAARPAYGPSHDPVAGVQAADRRTWAADYARDDPAARHVSGMDHPDWVTTGDRFEGDADGHDNSFGERAKAGAALARDRAAAAGHGAAQSGRDAGPAAAERAARVRERLTHGTERMGMDARERVIAARERAMAARYRAGRDVCRGWRRGRDAGIDVFEDQPLVAGALALAAGAAIASLLPRTRTEDDLFGEEADHMVSEAERIFHEELTKAERVGDAALTEARTVADEKAPDADGAAQEAVKTAADEAREATDRVRSAARDEAQRQNLGKPDA